MTFKALLVICLVGGIVTLVKAGDGVSEITKFMKHLEVIPDLIDEGPKNFLKVFFRGERK